MTDDTRALAAWTKAETRLSEGLALDPKRTPRSIAVSAYFAMFHVARAVILRATRSSPERPSSVARQFEALARDRGIALERGREDLKKVRALRERADYGSTPVAAEDARDALQRTKAFIDLCAREFGFPRERKPENG